MRVQASRSKEIWPAGSCKSDEVRCTREKRRHRTVVEGGGRRTRGGKRNIGRTSKDYQNSGGARKVDAMKVRERKADERRGEEPEEG